MTNTVDINSYFQTFGSPQNDIDNEESILDMGSQASGASIHENIDENLLVPIKKSCFEIMGLCCTGSGEVKLCNVFTQKVARLAMQIRNISMAISTCIVACCN